MDNRTPEQRKKNMRAVKNKNSQIEIILRKALWQRGIRYRKNVKKIYGCPDIAFIKNALLCFVTANFGTGLIGKIERRNLNRARISGFQK